jgi:creatinine amidohydrolase
MNSGRPYVLAETTWKLVSVTKYQAAVLPWGATEAHNFHLPYGTDTLQAERLAQMAAQRAWDAGARVVVLPAVPFGVQTGQLDIPFCLNLNPSSQAAILGNLADSVRAAGVRKLVLLNGHGGNDFRAIVRELQPRISVLLCVVDWYRIVPSADFFREPGDHAGELETSVMQHLAPDWVRPLSEAGPGSEHRPRIAAFREGWAWTPRPWSRISDDTGVGSPAAATPEKGRRYAEAVADKLAAFLIDLAAADPDDLYERP